jgi:hypothetical protein
MTIRFESMQALYNYCQSTPAAGAETSLMTSSPSWDLNAGWEGAMRILAAGGYWADGTKNITRAAAVFKHDEAEIQTLRTKLDIVGSSPAVASYLRGAPRNMRRQTPYPAPAPVIKIGINVLWACTIDSTELVNLGAAWSSVIATLEATGQRCEVEAFFISGTTEENNDLEKRHQWADIRVKIKSADQPYNPATMAFMLAHPAALRRCIFRVIENEYTPLTRRGYGNARLTSAMTTVFNEQFDRWSPPLVSSMRDHLRTPEAARDWLISLLNK